MVSIALLTVSDTRDIKNDDSGQFLVDSLKIEKHHISNRIICKDNVYIIRKYISDWIADDEIDVIITTGGTGLTYTDVTPEAIKPLLDKEIEGFIDQLTGEQFTEIMEFFNTMPKLRHIIEVTNPNTKVKSEVVLEGLQNFLG